MNNKEAVIIAIILIFGTLFLFGFFLSLSDLNEIQEANQTDNKNIQYDDEQFIGWLKNVSQKMQIILGNIETALNRVDPQPTAYWFEELEIQAEKYRNEINFFHVSEKYIPVKNEFSEALKYYEKAGGIGKYLGEEWNIDLINQITYYLSIANEHLQNATSLLEGY